MDFTPLDELSKVSETLATDESSVEAPLAQDAEVCSVADDIAISEEYFSPVSPVLEENVVDTIEPVEPEQPQVSQGFVATPENLAVFTELPGIVPSFNSEVAIAAEDVEKIEAVDEVPDDAEVVEGVELVGELSPEVAKQLDEIENVVDDEILAETEQPLEDIEDAPVEDTPKELKRRSRRSRSEGTSHLFRDSDDCKYFGYDEQAVSKFHFVLMAIWSFLLNTLYILTVGGLVVAPITFIIKKFDRVISRRWLSILISCSIYFLVIGLFVLLICLVG